MPHRGLLRKGMHRRAQTLGRQNPRSCRAPIALLALLGFAGTGSLVVISGCGRDAQGSSTPIRAPSTKAPPSPPTAAAIDPARLHPGFDPQSPCTCDVARMSNGWCWHCNIGYIAGRRVECARLFETLDPHGHQLDLQSLNLEVCHDAMRNDGYCDAVGIGFVKGLAFFTRLTYGLGMGTPIEPSAISCAECRAHVDDPGWCDRCHRGMVGNVAITDRDLFERTAREYRILLMAMERAKTCEWCAAAMVVHHTCPNCRISYEGGPDGCRLPPPPA